jgi:hypothetical protein
LVICDLHRIPRIGGKIVGREAAPPGSNSLLLFLDFNQTGFPEMARRFFVQPTYKMATLFPFCHPEQFKHCVIEVSTILMLIGLRPWQP